MTAINKVQSMVALLSKNSPGDDLTSLASPAMAFARGALDEILAVLTIASQSPVAAKTPPERVIALLEIRRGAALIKLALAAFNGKAYLRLSPQRAYPQLYVGRDNIDGVFKLLWASIDAAVAVSATLYLRRTDGPSGAYMAGLLQIPDAKRAEYPPIEASWLRDCVTTVHVPEGDEAKALRPPSRLDKLSEHARQDRMQAWLDSLALKIKDIHATASGGVLVLNTSYEMVKGLRERLGNSSVDIVTAHEGRSMQRQSEEFLGHAVAGRKAIWLAVGGAWTGLDIGGHEPLERLLGVPQIPASEDNALTDLVIPRLPFGTNNSITHLRRMAMSSNSVPWDMLDAAFRMLQGLGRLVRRKGLPVNRRIWVLDGRLDDTTASQRLALFWSAIRGSSMRKFN
jgi:CRISPR type IV-associated DEAD/DEAH-box helicase Csf4